MGFYVWLLVMVAGTGMLLGGFLLLSDEFTEAKKKNAKNIRLRKARARKIQEELNGNVRMIG